MTIEVPEHVGDKLAAASSACVIRQMAAQATPLLIFAVITAYVGWAVQHQLATGGPVRHTLCDGFGFLLIVYALLAVGYAHAYIWRPYIATPLASRIVQPALRCASAIFAKSSIYRWIAALLALAAVAAYVIVDAWAEPDRLISGGGFVCFLALGYLMSDSRQHINWAVIVRGVLLQFAFGMLTLRWPTGRAIFSCAGDKVTTFLGYAQDGAAFVYGAAIVHGANVTIAHETYVTQAAVFAFSALSTIYFLGFVINILYHVGVMQSVILALGACLRSAVGTSLCESVNSAANIFLGMSEAPLLLGPYLAQLTASELHAMMTAGFASVSGTVLAAYIAYGAAAAHLITASVMAAPAGLVFSKLLVPERETPASAADIAVTRSEYASALEAGSQGAVQATQLVLGIVANLIAFISTVAFANGVLGWMGGLVGFEGDGERWTVELLMGYVFMPVSFLLGVPWSECRLVGKLIGLKTMVNEFAAFSQFADAKRHLSPRSQIITTFALCGFANPGSMGVMVSTLSTLMPTRSALVTRHVFSAFVAGTIVCLMTACMAGMLTSVAHT